MAKLLNSILCFFLILSEAKVVAPLLTVAEVHALMSRECNTSQFGPHISPTYHVRMKLYSLGYAIIFPGLTVVKEKSLELFAFAPSFRRFLEFDIRKCFHTINRHRLIPIFKEEITDPKFFYPIHKVFSASRSSSLHVLAITEVKAQKRCTAILDPTGCVLVDCQKQCLEKYNGNGLCTGGVTGPMNCVCVFNCSSN